MKKVSVVILSVLAFSCVSKKKFLALEAEKNDLTSELTKSQLANEELESKFSAIQQRVDSYNAKITSLQEDKDTMLEVNEDGSVTSNKAKEQMRSTLAKVDPSKLSGAKTLKDSMNVAIAYNLEQAINSSSIGEEDEDIAVDINETVVMISISDKMLFNTGSYRISSKANPILEKLAAVINSEPSLEVMVEGHTDARTISTEKVADNWDLSVLRATSVVRKLQNKYEVAPDKLIASGRSSFKPVTNNDTAENRAKNRRTRILILPNMDKLFALMASN